MLKLAWWLPGELKTNLLVADLRAWPDTAKDLETWTYVKPLAMPFSSTLKLLHLLDTKARKYYLIWEWLCIRNTCVLKAIEYACLSREIQECCFVPQIWITHRCLLGKWQFADMKYSQCTCIWCRASPQGKTLRSLYTDDPRKYSLSTRKMRKT